MGVGRVKEGMMRLLSPRSNSGSCSGGCPRCGGLPGPEEKRNDDETEGNDDTDSPEGLEGDASSLRGEDGCDEVPGRLACVWSGVSDMCRGGSWRIVSALVLGCSSSSSVERSISWWLPGKGSRMRMVAVLCACMG